MKINSALVAPSVLTTKRTLVEACLEAAGYFMASLAALVLDLAVFSVGMRLLDLPWSIAASLSFIAGVFLAYQLSIRWVFLQRQYRQNPQLEWVTFVAVGIVGLAITQVILWIGIEILGKNPEITRFIASGVTFVCNFFGRKLLLFRNP